MSPRSFLWLAVHLLLRLLGTLWGRGRGLARFLSGYVREEGLVPVGPTEREVGRRAARCVGCGLCDAMLPSPPEGLLPPSAVLLGASRSLHRLEQALPSLRWLEAHPLREAERVCPRAVPLEEVVVGLKRMAEEAVGTEQYGMEESAR